MERLRPFNEYQAIQSFWQEKVLSKEEEGFNEKMAKFQEEADEVNEAYEAYKENPLEKGKHLAEEIADVIIIGLGCLSSLGFDFERLFLEKMEKNWRKYNPSLLDELQKQGLTRKGAIKRAKEIWNKKSKEC